MTALFGSMTGIFLIYHLGALFRNETNIERLFENNFVDRYLTYDLGPYQNFKEIFGENWTLWFIPVFTTKGNNKILFYYKKGIRGSQLLHRIYV